MFLRFLKHRTASLAHQGTWHTAFFHDGANNWAAN